MNKELYDKVVERMSGLGIPADVVIDNPAVWIEFCRGNVYIIAINRPDDQIEVMFRKTVNKIKN